MKYSAVGHVCTASDHANFEEAFKQYRAGAFRSLRDAYNWMTTNFYSVLETEDGIPVISVLPPDERPTLNQFYYYVHKHFACMH